MCSSDLAEIRHALANERWSVRAVWGAYLAELARNTNEAAYRRQAAVWWLEKRDERVPA